IPGVVVFPNRPWHIPALTVGSEIVSALRVYFEMKVTRTGGRMGHVERVLVLGTRVIAFLRIRAVRRYIGANPGLGTCIDHVARVGVLLFPGLRQAKERQKSQQSNKNATRHSTPPR